MLGKDLAQRAAEPALGRVGRALYEGHDGRLQDQRSESLLDGLRGGRQLQFRHPQLFLQDARRAQLLDYI